VIVSFIDEHREAYGVEPIAVDPSAYRYRLSQSAGARERSSSARSLCHADLAAASAGRFRAFASRQPADDSVAVVGLTAAPVAVQVNSGE
jgi:hypothetical protein